MEFGHVGLASIIGMVFQLCIAFGMPVALLICMKIKGARISSFFIGCGTFVLFALMLEQLCHALVLSLTGNAIRENIWLAGLYGGLAAALFEEAGRYVAMRYWMKKDLDLPNALMYGAGHGGVEAVLLLGFTGINNLLYSAIINSGETGAIEQALNMLDEETAAATLEQIASLWTSPAYLFYIGGIERILAITGHIAMSVLVFLAVKNGKAYCWAAAFAAHFLLDFVASVSAAYLPAIAVELVIALMAAGIVRVAVVLYRREMPLRDSSAPVSESDVTETGKLSDFSE